MIGTQLKLDNPAWHSLSESNQNFAIDYGDIKFYHPDYCLFGGYEKPKIISDHLSRYATLVDNFFVIGEKPELPNQLNLRKELVCLQMVIENPVLESDDVVVKLTTQDSDDLYELVNLVQPGYFKKKTMLLGDYFGIFKNGDLVAVTGERMKMNAFVEVSAVVTHPNYTGQGLAKQLVSRVVNNIFDQNKIPYLHVSENNILAIKLYEKLGFETRRKMSFWNIAK